MGYMVFKYHNLLIYYLNRNWVILSGIILYFITFIIGIISLEQINAIKCETIYQKIFYLTLKNIIEIIYSTIGVIVAYVIISRLKSYSYKDSIVKFP